SVTLYYTARDGERYQLNMIDTPGHVDFSYEVSRSLAACDGALLVVDASQGVEAQSVANCNTAIEQGLEVLPVINKIDLPSADPERVTREIEEIIGIQATDAAPVSAKTGEGVPELLETLIRRIPPPRGSAAAPLQALIIDSWFDNYVGVVSLVRVMNGSLKSGDKIRVVSTGRSHLVDRLGRFTPKPVVARELSAGDVGFVVAGIKEIREPIIVANILVPPDHVGAVLKLCTEKRGTQNKMQYLGTQVSLQYQLPLAEVVLDFFDRLKSASRGYASFDYEFSHFQAAPLVKLDILINGDKVDALSIIVHRDSAYQRGRE